MKVFMHFLNRRRGRRGNYSRELENTQQNIKESNKQPNVTAAENRTDYDHYINAHLKTKQNMTSSDANETIPYYAAVFEQNSGIDTQNPLEDAEYCTIVTVLDHQKQTPEQQDSSYEHLQ